MYILDTNVVSELRKGAKADRNVRVWARTLPAASLYLSAISILELEVGIRLMERRDSKQGVVLRTWMHKHVLPTFADRVLPIDLTVAQQCAALRVLNPRSDRDALIGATALVHGMTVVTRNLTHFEDMGVKVIDPWK
jgi:predicted nucleic acid-binding protein